MRESRLLKVSGKILGRNFWHTHSKVKIHFAGPIKFSQDIIEKIILVRCNV